VSFAPRHRHRCQDPRSRCRHSRPGSPLQAETAAADALGRGHCQAPRSRRSRPGPPLQAITDAAGRGYHRRLSCAQAPTCRCWGRCALGRVGLGLPHERHCGDAEAVVGPERRVGAGTGSITGSEHAFRERKVKEEKERRTRERIGGSALALKIRMRERLNIFLPVVHLRWR
jgi:hypothetical protein